MHFNAFYLSCLMPQLNRAVNANARLHEVGAAASYIRGGAGISAELVVATAVTVASVKQTRKLQVL